MITDKNGGGRLKKQFAISVKINQVEGKNTIIQIIQCFMKI